MKASCLFILSILIFQTLLSQDSTESIITKSYYNKWSVTFNAKELFEYERGSDVNGEVKNGVTVLYFPQTMIDDGIYGSVGIMLTKDKKPEYILGISFPVGIGNKSYEDLANNDMSVMILLMSDKDSVLNSVSYGSLEDQVTVGGSEFKGRLYRFIIDSDDFNKLKVVVPNKMLLYYNIKNSKAKPKKRPPAGNISSKNAMISKFSALARSMEKVKIKEIH